MARVRRLERSRCARHCQKSQCADHNQIGWPREGRACRRVTVAMEI
uniref:Uncharacterized protein n=1 Tax=Arundo donax TaxID=35708 RepID=A0A0A8ZQ18_ARUDO